MIRGAEIKIQEQLSPLQTFGIRTFSYPRAIFEDSGHTFTVSSDDGICTQSAALVLRRSPLWFEVYGQVVSRWRVSPAAARRPPRRAFRRRRLQISRFNSPGQLGNSQRCSFHRCRTWFKSQIFAAKQLQKCFCAREGFHSIRMPFLE